MTPKERSLHQKLEDQISLMVPNMPEHDKRSFTLEKVGKLVAEMVMIGIEHISEEMQPLVEKLSAHELEALDIKRYIRNVVIGVVTTFTIPTVMLFYHAGEISQRFKNIETAISEIKQHSDGWQRHVQEQRRKLEGKLE